MADERGPLILHGVDFSGGASHAGKVWVATRDAESVTLRRGFDHRAIVDLIVASAEDGQRHLWRIDAPFGNALEALQLHELESSWLAMARWMASFDDARAWRTACRERSRREPRRLADSVARTPMAPTNLRVFKQTWAVITQVLLPLADRGIRIEPLVGDAAGPIVVAEGCPASAMHLRAWPVRGYKGAGDPPRHRRREIVSAIRDEGVPLSTDVARRAVDDTEGDGVDALLLVLDPAPTVVPEVALVEGWVYT